MATYDIVLPRLGEGVIEATLTKWLVKEGAMISEEEPVAEIATDKVDTEIPAPVTGKVIRLNVVEGEVVAVGKVLAVIEIEEAGSTSEQSVEATKKESPAQPEQPSSSDPHPADSPVSDPIPTPDADTGETEESGSRFYSPLVRSIARQESIPFDELGRIRGTGKNDRLTKQDLLDYLAQRTMASGEKTPPKPVAAQGVKPMASDEIVEMDRIRQLIASHMVHSVHTSPHVSSFVEVDMTRVVQWREQNKASFLKQEGIKLTYTPILIEAIAKAVRAVPMMNSSVDGTRIIRRNRINIGMAVALPNGNLIVPVIHDADQKNLLGIVHAVTDLANRARGNKLQPDDISSGTISLTNLGSFGTLMGTPIINQPQAAIVAIGSIVKKPVVIETAEGDTIGIRHRMILSVTFDHRVIDGAMAGEFLNRLTAYLEQFDTHQSF